MNIFSLILISSGYLIDRFLVHIEVLNHGSKQLSWWIYKTSRSSFCSFALAETEGCISSPPGSASFLVEYNIRIIYNILIYCSRMIALHGQVGFDSSVASTH